MSYKDHPRPEGMGLSVDVAHNPRSGEVVLSLGTMRNFGSISMDAWAALTPKEARELADDLWAASRRAEKIDD